jgi:phage tail sheath protein FI
MLGWNYRASGGNVKQWRINYALSASSTANVWVSFSGNAADGEGLLLRKAQRKAATRSLQSAIASNADIRNETNRFNLVAVPGYSELADEMLTLSVDRKDTVFSIIDTPLRLAADNTSTAAWATNANTAVENGENGLVSASAQAGVYYPHALTTNTDGTNILVPASHMALRTYAYNDQVAFPWFAPAGFQRGIVSNATSVGYLDSKEGEYVPVSLNEGQRDGLYLNKVNPIASFPGRGISVFGQKTLNPSASALDRVNVSRLVIYIREQLDDAVKPFLFEPNDSVTRTNAKSVVDRFLSELITQRGLFDFVTVCDDSNNTPARIDRNELHIDVAIQPVKAVEFIYIPIRIQNTLGSTG